MQIANITYAIEYEDQHPPANIVLVTDETNSPMTEAECRAIIEPIILKLSRILQPKVMMKLSFAVRDEANGDNQFIADFWREAERKFLS